MVRSPHPHARIVSIDSTAAAAMPGVLGVFTGADCLHDGLKPIPHNPVPSTKYDMKLTGRGGTPVFIGPHMLLPHDKARHVGEAVAMVVAETLQQAQTAAEEVVVDYEVLPWVADTAAAAEPGAARVWDELPDNVLVDSRFGDFERTEAVFAKAPHVVSMRAHVGRVTGVPLEPRAALGSYDAATGRFTLYAGSGGAVRQKHELANVLGVEPANVRVLSFDVGGNFGTRNRAYVEFGLVMWASRTLGRPVKFRAERSEAFLTDYQGRDLVTDVSLAIDHDGRFLAMRASNLSNVGARCVSLSPLSKGSGLITGSYDIPIATLHSRAVFSNTMPTQAYRSSGRPEVTFAIERLVDKAARELGFDRLELRRRNLVQPEQMPYTNAVGSTYDSGTYEANMDRVLVLADWNGFAPRRAEARRRGKLLGLGFANYVESSIGTPKERADLIVNEDGIEVVIGTQPAGQGHETSFAQVAADLLGVPFEVVKITLGDTDIVSAGGGTHSGRSMRHASAVISLGADDLIAKGRALMAHVTGVPADMVRFEDGVFRGEGSNQALTWFELARHALREDLPEQLRGGLRVRRDNEMHTPVFPNGACCCEIEIDPETGGLDITRYATVDDVGRLHQSADRAWPDPWRHRPGRRPGNVGAMRHRSVVRPADRRLVHGLRHAALRQPAVVQDADRGSAVAHQSVRHQGGRRRRHDAGARRDHERDRECAGGIRRAADRHAGDAGKGLERDPRRRNGCRREAGQPHRQWRDGHPHGAGRNLARRVPARASRHDRHPCGLRHHPMRLLRRPSRRQVGEILHRARRPGRGPARHHHRGGWRKAPCCIRCRRRSVAATPCNAGFARPA